MNVRANCEEARIVSGIHAGKPWREVERIEETTGAHGGVAWMLTLSCGHIAVRSQPRFRMFEPVVRVAPKRVRCIVCPGASVKS